MAEHDLSSGLVEKVISPRISIIIPYYQQLAYVADCLTSIIAQSFEHWEAIIVDDASGDGKYLRALLASLGDNRIRLIEHEVNRGLAASRNTGALHATTDLLAFVDADDMLAPNFCECMVTLFAENPYLDVAFSLIELIGDETGVHYLRGNNSELQYQLRYWLPGAGVVMRHSVWKKLGGYNEHTLLRLGMEDRDFWIRSLSLDLSIAQIVQPLYKWRRYNGSMSDRLQPHYYRLHHFIGQYHKQTLRQMGVYQAFIAEGYFQSARYFAQQGNHLKALYLALRGLYTQPSHHKLWRLIFYNLFLSFVHKSIAMLKEAFCSKCTFTRNNTCR